MTTRLYIGNLPISATEADLRLKFGRFGTVDSVIISTDLAIGRRGRHGFVGMANENEARTAINRLNMTQYEDTVMSVSIAPVNNVDALPTGL
jgi:RNA recognition motif-containing protein